MADVKISDLPQAVNIEDEDLILTVQEGITKGAKALLVKGQISEEQSQLIDNANQSANEANIKAQEALTKVNNVEDKVDIIVKAQSSLNTVLNYGAKGDGITDDTLAIKNAIAGTQAGAELIFPQGIYLVSSTIQIKSDINIVGNGTPIIKNVSTFTTSQNPIFFINAKENVIIDGITFQSNTDINYIGGIRCLDSTNVNILSCNFYDIPEYGIQIGYKGNKNVLIRDCAFKNNKETSINIQGVEGCLVDNVQILPNTIGDLSNKGLSIAPTTEVESTVVDLQINNCIIDGIHEGLSIVGSEVNLTNTTIKNCVNHGILSTDGKNNKYTKCKVINNGYTGVYIQGVSVNLIFDSCVFANNAIGGIWYTTSETGSKRIEISNSEFYDNVGYGAKFSPSAVVHDIKINNNRFYNTLATKPQEKGIVLWGGGDYNNTTSVLKEVTIDGNNKFDNTIKTQIDNGGITQGMLYTGIERMKIDVIRPILNITSWDKNTGRITVDNPPTSTNYMLYMVMNDYEDDKELTFSGWSWNYSDTMYNRVYSINGNDLIVTDPSNHPLTSLGDVAKTPIPSHFENFGYIGNDPSTFKIDTTSFKNKDRFVVKIRGKGAYNAGDFPSIKIGDNNENFTFNIRYSTETGSSAVETLNNSHLERYISLDIHISLCNKFISATGWVNYKSSTGYNSIFPIDHYNMLPSSMNPDMLWDVDFITLYHFGLTNGSTIIVEAE